MAYVEDQGSQWGGGEGASSVFLPLGIVIPIGQWALGIRWSPAQQRRIFLTACSYDGRNQSSNAMRQGWYR